MRYYFMTMNYVSFFMIMVNDVMFIKLLIINTLVISTRHRFSAGTAWHNRQITCHFQGGAKGSVRLLLTENPRLFLQLTLTRDAYLV